MASIRIGNAPCSWGSLEFDGLEGESITHTRMLDELAETGYAGTELGDWGFMPTDPQTLHQTLACRKLTMLGAFVPVAFKNKAAHEEGEKSAVRIAKLLSSAKDTGPVPYDPYIVLADENGTIPERTNNAGRITPAMGLTGTEWKTYAEGVEQVAKAVSDTTGLRCVFHHHCGGYVETPTEIARLLDLTDPALVGLVFDTGHYAFGSGTPTAACVNDGLQRFGGRIWYVHFKDCDPVITAQAAKENWDYFQSVSHGVFCELGRGCVDFNAIKQWLVQRNYNGWICVEQDVLPGMGQPKESARRNREFLSGIGL